MPFAPLIVRHTIPACPHASTGDRPQACSSPGYYFEVSPTDGISQAMNTLFQKAVSTARITS